MALDLSERRIAARPPLAGHKPRFQCDSIESLTLRHVVVPMDKPISDAKVLTGRQSPLAALDLLMVEVVSAEGHKGLGFSYTLRAGGAGMYALGCELAPFVIGQDPNDISRIWERLAWQGISLGRGGMSYQAICAFDVALWDMKARRAGLPLAKLFGAHRDSVRIYNSSGQYLQASIDEMKAAAEASIARGIGGIKMKVGQPDGQEDLKRIDAMRAHLPEEIALMIDANQQWDRAYALQFGRVVDGMGLAFIEEPLDAWDFDGHAELARALATPVATGEMLTSPQEHFDLIGKGGCDVSQVDVCRIGGFTPMLKVMTMAEAARIELAPHMVMELHIHAAAAFGSEGWVEHFEWWEPLFDERLEISGGKMHVPDRPGLGFTLSDQARGWTQAEQNFGGAA
ncbi:mandelate racemase/muconate lactonizing enzyme family protein [Oceanicola sp. 502str15]|uniref:L-talarate/galactarate dehydratase n=1 Tax=Oceanicola sp. 502str15 TaxID=2696061 RepID=UPI002094CA03|nr:mandelate racemase/muconate lactonizing enzyme family protein [Oceanicola sp. 502str15]MCO6384712.1 enolase [Oceanicola sp. 502str15]